MRKLRYHLVDVFTNRAFGGNPLAVFTNGRDLAPMLMQAIAKELNLSETTFVLPPQDPDNDYRVRIFTPGVELPFAGHPTVGTAYVLAREHLIDTGQAQSTIRLEEGVGPIPVSLAFEEGQPRFIQMGQPLPTFGLKFHDRDALAALLSLDVSALEPELPLEVVSCGVPFLFVPLRSLEAIRQAKLRLDLWEKLLKDFQAPHLFLFTREVEYPNSSVHSRMFAPAMGIAEDPATGGASGPLGCYLVKHGLVPPQATAQIVSEQGFEIGRKSFLHIEIDRLEDEITGVRVGGECFYMGEGLLEV